MKQANMTIKSNNVKNFVEEEKVNEFTAHINLAQSLSNYLRKHLLALLALGVP